MSVVGAIVGAVKAVVAAARGRSTRWPAVRARHLAEHPACAACGGRSGVEVHHVLPVGWPGGRANELDPANLITLCPGHHLWVGHLGDWRARNPECRADAAAVRAKVAARAYPPPGESSPEETT